MALVIEHPTHQADRPAQPISAPPKSSSPTDSEVDRLAPTVEEAAAPSFGRSCFLTTVLAALVIIVTTVVAWSSYRGGFFPGLGIGVNLAFWFAPAIGLIGGGTYWVTNNPIH
ncbi:MAG: hypothetical protein ACI8TP_000998 [Acidimicrobiales bacterium]|jgi:hypothetical protein